MLGHCFFLCNNKLLLTYVYTSPLQHFCFKVDYNLVKIVLIDFLLTVKAATLIFISGRGLAISSAKEGKSGFIYNLVKG